MKFIEGFMRIQDKTLVGNIKREKNKQSAVIRYQKRATNQLVKAVHHLAKGEEF
jgi:hypothetical protein